MSLNKARIDSLSDKVEGEPLRVVKKEKKSILGKLKVGKKK